MKKIIVALFMTFGSFCWANAPMLNIPQIDPFDLLNNMDPKELDKLMDDLAKMSPEEIKYYEDLGKQMFKQSGYDLDEIAKSFPAPAPAPAPQPKQPAIPAKPATQEKPKPVTDDTTSKKEKDSLLRMVTSLSESLASIRQKAASDETLHPHLAPLQQELDLLTAYVNRFDYERHLKYLAEKEFAALKTKLRKMSSMLEEFDNNLVVPELTLRKPTDTKKASYGAQVQQATSVIKEFKSYMSRAFSSDAIITDIENLFKKHDQEALIIKKQIEEQQKKASEQVKKLSVTNTGRFAPIPKVTNQPIKHQPGSGSYNQSGGGSRGGNYPSAHQGTAGQAQKPMTPQAPKAGDKAKAADKPGEKGKDAEAKTRGKKDEDFAEVPLTPEEQLEKVKTDLRSVNVQVAQHKEALNRIVDAMAAGTKPSVEDREILQTLKEKLADTKDTINSYLAKLKKDFKEKNPALITKSKKILKDSFATNFDAAIAMNEKFVALAPMVGPFAPEVQAALDDAKGLIDEFKKSFAKIEEQINPITRS